MLNELTFVDSVLLITVFDLAAVRGKFSCKNTPKFTARPELGRTSPNSPAAQEVVRQEAAASTTAASMHLSAEVKSAAASEV